jgi:hypothetical protein
MKIKKSKAFAIYREKFIHNVPDDYGYKLNFQK